MNTYIHTYIYLYRSIFLCYIDEKHVPFLFNETQYLNTNLILYNFLVRLFYTIYILIK